MRINKYLSQSGFGSRRKVEELITQGMVSVNGTICMDLATDIDVEKDQVTVRGKKAVVENDYFYILLNKPKHYLVTADDPFDRRTVFDLLPEFKGRLFPVGRLDYDSEGLLLLTNDGEFSQMILHPSKKIPKTYHVKIKGRLEEKQILRLRKGLELEDGMTMPAKVFVRETNDGSMTLKMVIVEGRNRQIRRMIEAVGGEVTGLKRTQIGNVKLGKIPKGMWRFLEPNEIRSLRFQARANERKKS